MEILKKKIGPFTVGVWSVIVVGGIGLGFVMRRFVGGSEGEGSEPTPLTIDYSEAGIGGFPPSGGGTLPKPPFIEPGDGSVTPNNDAAITALEAAIAGITKRIDALGNQIKAANNPDVKEGLRIEQRSLIAQKAGMEAELKALKAAS
jgi:hypothetical protein